MRDSSSQVLLGDPSSDVECRLIVTWRRPETSSYHAIGLLEQTADGLYAFTYLKAAQHLPGFRPLVGFSELSRRYESPHLFALFAERVMDPARPDREQWLAELGLDRDAGPMEVLSRNAGQRQGDRLELTPVPTWDPTTRETRAIFLTHGVRHHAGAVEMIAELEPGERLDLHHVADNAFNPDAVAVATTDGTRLGWVPDPLLHYVHEVRRSATDAASVVVANGVDTDPHVQLVAQLVGTLPSDFVDPFVGADWQLAAQPIHP